MHRTLTLTANAVWLLHKATVPLVHTLRFWNFELPLETGNEFAPIIQRLTKSYISAVRAFHKAEKLHTVDSSKRLWSTSYLIALGKVLKEIGDLIIDPWHTRKGTRRDLLVDKWKKANPCIKLAARLEVAAHRLLQSQSSTKTTQRNPPRSAAHTTVVIIASEQGTGAAKALRDAILKELPPAKIEVLPALGITSYIELPTSFRTRLIRTSTTCVFLVTNDDDLADKSGSQIRLKPSITSDIALNSELRDSNPPFIVCHTAFAMHSDVVGFSKTDNTTRHSRRLLRFGKVSLLPSSEELAAFAKAICDGHVAR